VKQLLNHTSGICSQALGAPNDGAWEYVLGHTAGLSRALAISCVLATATAAVAGREDQVVADFEGPTYGAWKVEGTAFGPGPARGTLPGQMAVAGFLGGGLVNSFHGGDGATGRLTSPPFRIERRYLRFLIGGGKHPGRTCINLLVDGMTVRTATGPNDRPGGSELLEAAEWDLADLAGKSAVIEIVDQATGGWGHVNVDQVVQTDRKLPALRVDVTRTFRLRHRYLNLPVKTGAPKRRMSLLIDGRAAREFDIELAEGEPDFWAFLDVSGFRGKEAQLKVDRLPEGAAGLDNVVHGDALHGAEELYREPLRPQFHFTSRRGWLNDPNGLVYSRGEYHLFYQHNPYGWGWGNMQWGHAVSKDLVRWRELPVAIYPKEYGDWAFSGSAVIDRDNTSGFRQSAGELIVASYTSTGRGECIVYSQDGGRTFTEYAGNPVVKHQGRDPRLVWYGPGRHWVMAVYDEQGTHRGIAFYTSPDLREWQRRSWIDGYFECPELFELPVDRSRTNSRWVLYGADGSYALGKFDGKTFTPEGPKQPASFGDCFYASQVYSDVPPSDGRRIRIGWGRGDIPGMPFNQMMNFPVELSLRTTDQGPRLFAWPVKEISALHGRLHEIKAASLPPGANPFSGLSGELWDIGVELDPGTAAETGLSIRGVPIIYRRAEGRLVCRGHSAPLKPVEGTIRLRVLVDRTSLEIFANDGRVYMPIAVIPKPEDRSLQLFARGGTAHIRSGAVIEMKPAWPRPRE